MNMKKVQLLVGILIISINVHAQILTLVDSIKLSNASIWGVCSDDGDSLCVTSTFSPASKPHIFMRKIDYSNINSQGPIVQLTFDADFASIPNLTDHKSIILNNEIYIAFSTIGDADLFLFKTDINGNRIGNIVTVVSGSPDPTNDMMLVTDGTYIYVLHFAPPSQQHVYKYDSNLNLVAPPFLTTTNDHNNLGNVIFQNNEFHMFTGDIFGFNANLIYTKWSNSWGPVSKQTILNSVGGDGNFFADGVAYDILNQRWYIAMNHIYSGQVYGQEHIDLVVFDNNFNLLERKHLGSQGATRSHLVLKNGYLYMTYDIVSSGVYLHKYMVQNNTGINQVKESLNFIQIFPNPFSTEATIQATRSLKDATLTIENILGQTVAKINNIEGNTINLHRNNLPAGVYIVRLIEDHQILTTQKIMITD